MLKKPPGNVGVGQSRADVIRGPENFDGEGLANGIQSVTARPNGVSLFARISRISAVSRLGTYQFSASHSTIRHRRARRDDRRWARAARLRASLAAPPRPAARRRERTARGSPKLQPTGARGAIAPASRSRCAKRAAAHSASAARRARGRSPPQARPAFDARQFRLPQSPHSSGRASNPRESSILERNGSVRVKKMRENKL